jgi:hypothetical protein
VAVTDETRLKVLMELQNRGFIAKTKQSQAVVNRFEKRVTGALTRIKGAFAAATAAITTMKGALVGLAGVLALGFFANATRSAVRFGDNLVQTADKIGLSVESLQELRFAASTVGLAANVADTAFQRFGRRAAEAAQGGGSAAKAFKELGIVLEDANGQFVGLDNVLDQFADGLSKAGNSGDQLRLSFAGFDTEGAQLTNLFKQGKEALQGYREQARELGVVLSTETARAASLLNAELDISTQRIGTNLTRAFLQAAPAAISFTDKLADATDAIVLFFSRSTDAADATDRQLRLLRDDASDAVEELRLVVKTQNELGAGTGRLGQFIGRLARAQITDQLVAAEELLAGIENEQLERTNAAIAAEKARNQGRESALINLKKQAEAEAALLALKLRQETNLRTLITAEMAHAVEVAGAIDVREGEIVKIEQYIESLEALELVEAEEGRRVAAIARERKKLNDLRFDIDFDKLSGAGQFRETRKLQDIPLGERAGFGNQAVLSDIIGGDPNNPKGLTGAGLRQDQEKAAEASRQQAAIQDFGDDFGNTVAGSLSGAIEDAFFGDGIDFMKTFAEVGSGFLQKGLEGVLDQLATKISETFQGLGEGFGAALGVGLGIGAAILQGALRETETDVSRGRIKSAVTSTQEVRGVVAGPTSIAVAQVGNAIADSFVPIEQLAISRNELLTEIRDGLRSVLSPSAGGAFFGGGPDLESSGALG